MAKNINTNVNTNTQPKKKKGLVIKIISAVLILFSLLCTLIIFKNSNTNLIPGVLGIILLVITMNVADNFKVNKHNAKAVAIISLVLDLLAILCAFYYVIFAYVLVVPALLLTAKCRKCDPKNKLSKISFFFSLGFFFICIFLSLGGYVKRTNG